MSAASWTVPIFSAPSSSSVISNCSSNAIMISTVSKESAPKSTNLESAATASRSVPSCSEMIPLTLSRVSPDCLCNKRKKKGERTRWRKSVWSHFGVFCELYPKQEMEEEKRTAAALTENPARALVATLLEVLKFTCLKLSRKDERERTYVSASSSSK